MQRADGRAETQAERWWERYQKTRMVIFAIVLFAAVAIGVGIFVASGG